MEETLLRTDLWYWTKQMRYIKGEKWSFEHNGVERKYLKQIYRDTSKDLLIVKGRQVEFTEFATNRVLQFASTHKKTTSLYTFPSGDLCATFGNQRIKEALFDSPRLRDQLVDDGNTFTKTFKNGSYIYLRTAFGGGDKARSIAADALYMDEYQDFDSRSKSDVPARDVLMSNLDHSNYKFVTTFGTPKLRDSNFNHLWDSSTMNLWHVICVNCQHIQVLSVSNIINWEEAWETDNPKHTYYGCVKCKTPLDRNNGFWKPTHHSKNITTSSYHVSQLLVPWKTSADILSAHGTRNNKGKSIRAFQNEVLGNFYSGSDQPFNEAVLERCYKTDETIWDASPETTYMGIDWGDISTICIIKYNVELDVGQIIYADKFGDQDALEQVRQIGDLVQRFHIGTIVADFGYGKVQNSELLKRFPGRVWANIYSHTREPELHTWKPKDMQVVVDREQSINLLVDRAEKGCDAAGGLIIPRDHKAKTWMMEYLQEMRNVVAVQKDNRTQYSRLGSGDHFMHALIYALTAAKKQVAMSRHTPRAQGVHLGRVGGGRGQSSGFRPGAQPARHRPR